MLLDFYGHIINSQLTGNGIDALYDFGTVIIAESSHCSINIEGGSIITNEADSEQKTASIHYASGNGELINKAGNRISISPSTKIKQNNDNKGLIVGTLTKTIDIPYYIDSTSGHITELDTEPNIIEVSPPIFIPAPHPL